MSFDLVKHDFSAAAEQGHSFNLILPNGEVSDAKFIVRGALSPTVQNYKKKYFTQSQAREAKAKRQGKEVEFTIEEAEDFAIDSAINRLIGWTDITENGKPVEFSEAKAREILRTHWYFRDQIFKESDDASNFPTKQ